jgi:ribosomal protein S6E (S10)
MNRLPLCAALCAALSFGALACENNQGGSTIHETEATPLPPIKVDLPPPPPFTAPTTPEKYPDGTYSVFGLHKNIEKLTGQQVTVKAYVREVYVCPECPKGQECKACEQPHYWITDEKEGKKEKAMMVVDYPTKKPLVETPPVFTVGAKVTVKGTFQRATLSGFNASDGLLTHLETKDENGQTISEGNTNVAFDTVGTKAGQGDKMRARVEGTDGKKILRGGPNGALPKKRGKK